MSASLTQDEADDLFDTLQADIEAASAKETELELVLARLEELILEDILSGDYAEDTNESASGNVTPSTAAVTPSVSEFGSAILGNNDEIQETFIQQKSLALLPLLCRFPLFTSSASDRLIRLIVLVSKRLNPKELWLGLDSVVETSRVGLEGLADRLDDPVESDDDDHDEEELVNDGRQDRALSEDILHESPEHISLYLSRALLAIQIVIPRIRVKKPEKYLKPVMDALTGCFTAFQSPELREQISEPNLFPGYLLLVNTAIFVKDTWAWAQSREAQSNSSLKSALVRLYLLAVRSLLPLCSETWSMYSDSSAKANPSRARLGSLLLESCLSLDIHSLDNLEDCFNATSEHEDKTSEWLNHVQRTISHVMLAPLYFASVSTTEEQSRTILSRLPGVLELIMAEDLDELVRTVALGASLALGHAATRVSSIQEENNLVIENVAEPSIYTNVRAIIQVIKNSFEHIGTRPPLDPNEPSPARKALHLCECLALDVRLESSDRNKIINMMLDNTDLRIKTVAVSILRKLVVAEDKGHASKLLKELLPTFGKKLFTWRPMTTGDIHDLEVQAFVVSLLNFIYVFNVRCGVHAESEDTTIAPFVADIGRWLEEAAVTSGRPAEDMVADEDSSLQTVSRFQLEIVKDALERATRSVTSGST